MLSHRAKCKRICVKMSRIERILCYLFHTLSLSDDVKSNYYPRFRNTFLYRIGGDPFYASIVQNPHYYGIRISTTYISN